MRKQELLEKYGEPNTPVDGSIEVTPSEARQLLKIHNNIQMVFKLSLISIWILRLMTLSF